MDDKYNQRWRVSRREPLKGSTSDQAMVEKMAQTSAPTTVVTREWKMASTMGLASAPMKG